MHFHIGWWSTGAPVRRFFSVFLKISQYSQETLALESHFNKNAGLKAGKFIKKRLQYRCFPCKYCKIFKNSVFTKHLSGGCFSIYHNIIVKSMVHIEKNMKLDDLIVDASPIKKYCVY